VTARGGAPETCQGQSEEEADALERRGAGAKRRLRIGTKRTLKTLLRFIGSDMWKPYLRSVRAYLLEEGLQRFWSYVSRHWAGVFLARWCTREHPKRERAREQQSRALRRRR
jgi:hypothetical protein